MHGNSLPVCSVHHIQSSVQVPFIFLSFWSPQYDNSLALCTIVCHDIVSSVEDVWVFLSFCHTDMRTL
jgi:hypothetical protein